MVGVNHQISKPISPTPAQCDSYFVYQRLFDGRNCIILRGYSASQLQMPKAVCFFIAPNIALNKNPHPASVREMQSFWNIFVAFFI